MKKTQARAYFLDDEANEIMEKLNETGFIEDEVEFLSQIVKITYLKILYAKEQAGDINSADRESLI